MKPPTFRFRLPRALRLMRNPLTFYRELGEEHGDLAQFRLGPVRICLVNRAEYVKQVLATEGRKFTKTAVYRILKPIMGEGLLTSEGQLHLRQRRLSQPSFLRQRMADYAPIMTAAAEERAAGWREGTTFDPSPEMSQLSLQIVGRTLFGGELDGDADAALEATEDLLKVWTVNRARLFMAAEMLRLPPPGMRKLLKVRDRLDAVIYRAIARRRHAPAGDDLLSRMVSAVDEEGDGRGMSDTQLRDEAVTFLLAGHETIATTLTWAWAMLAQYPHLEQRLHHELDSVLGDRTPEFSDLPRLDFTQRVFLECMRLFPPVWTIGRKAAEEVQLGPHTLQPGTIVVASPYVTHRRADYFPNPERFDPDRWLPESRARMPEMAYFPFGGGVRRCIGEPMVLTEGPLVLATLARRWRMELASAPPRETTHGLFLCPTPGLRMTLRRRTPLGPTRSIPAELLKG